MSKKIRYIILYPFSLIFGLIVSMRNFLYDKRVLKSRNFSIPILAVGNLTVGGTGKTPHTEYILSLLRYECKIAMLSRGYKRKTKGFYLADKTASAETIGDEPYQVHIKFPNIIVAVDEDRPRGVENLLRLFQDLEVVVLDDAFQHRAISSGLSILLTDYSRLYVNDFYLPSGNLRESKKGSKRADIIIVTKCPETITSDEIKAIENKIQLYSHQELFFSTFLYEELTPVFPEAKKNEILLQEKNLSVLFMAGIVSPQPAIDYLKNCYTDVQRLMFPDHHNFTEKNFEKLVENFGKMNMDNSIIVVTEKDASRIVSNSKYPEALKERTFALPIKVKILDEKERLFNEKIKYYVRENTTNS